MSLFDRDEYKYIADEEKTACMIKKARRRLEQKWSETRIGKILSRAEEEHPHLIRLITELHDIRAAWIEDNLQDELRELCDIRDFERDPYGYYGVSRRDFY